MLSWLRTRGSTYSVKTLLYSDEFLINNQGQLKVEIKTNLFELYFNLVIVNPGVIFLQLYTGGNAIVCRPM